MEGRVCHNPFAKFYEAGHDPLCPYIEEICPVTGDKIQRKPKSVITFINTLTDEEIGDYLTPDELKKMRAYKQPCDDDCGKELREKEEKKKKEQETLLERNQILELHARKLETDFNDYKEQTDRRMTQLAELVRSMLEDQQPKLKRTKTIVRE